MKSSSSFSVEQALRESHCADKDREHECVGTMLVTGQGVKLECPRCGGTEEPYYSRATRDKAKKMVNVVWN